MLGTDPDNPDTDGDAIDAGDEVHLYDTHPTNTDTDADGIEDYAEIDTVLTDPTVLGADADDGMNDGAKGAFGSDSLLAYNDTGGLTDPQPQAAVTDATNLSPAAPDRSTAPTPLRSPRSPSVERVGNVLGVGSAVWESSLPDARATPEVGDEVDRSVAS